MSGANLPCVLRATADFVFVRLHGPDPITTVRRLLLRRRPPLVGRPDRRMAVAGPRRLRLLQQRRLRTCRPQRPAAQGIDRRVRQEMADCRSKRIVTKNRTSHALQNNGKHLAGWSPPRPVSARPPVVAPPGACLSLDHLGHDAGADRLATLADGEPAPGLQGDRLVQAHVQRRVVAGHDHLDPSGQRQLAR